MHKKPLLSGLVLFWLAVAAPAFAGPTLSQRVAQIEQALQTNRQALAHYTWQQQEVITVGGSIKKQQTYQVKPMSGDVPLRTPIGRSTNKLSVGDAEYAEQIAALAEQYAQPPAGKLMQLLNQGSVLINPTDQADVNSVDVQGYIKPGDDVTILFNDKLNMVASIRVATYLTDQLNMVHINAQYAMLPEGVNHLDTLTVNGLSNNLVIQETNVSYQRVP